MDTPNDLFPPRPKAAVLAGGENNGTEEGLSAGDFHTPSAVTEDSINEKIMELPQEEQFRREKNTEYQE